MNGRRCPGLHCPGCDSGGGLVALVVTLAVIVSEVTHDSIHVGHPPAIAPPPRTSWSLPGQSEEIRHGNDTGRN